MVIIKKFDKFFENFSDKIEIDIDIKLPSDIIEISNAFINAGKDIYLVGGAIRDTIKGVKPKDYDLVTNALPDESKAILRRFNVSDEQGKNFGVLRIFTTDEPAGYELASYRKDISKGRDTKGDDVKVEIGNHITIEDDCNRRDFTCNALFYDIKNKKIIDIVGGISDIKNNIIRAVGNPLKRFNEDRLRILRAFRFSARIGADIDEPTKAAIKLDNRLINISKIDDVSQERIWEEMKKAFSQVKSFKKYLDTFTEFNMWNEVFPGSNINEEVIECDELSSYMANLFRFEDRLNLEKKMVIDYKIESRIVNKVIFLLDFLKITIDDVTDLYKKKIRCHITTSEIIDWLDLNGVTNLISIRFIDYLPTVSSEELISKGFKGKSLGDEIKRLEIENFKNQL